MKIGALSSLVPPVKDPSAAAAKVEGAAKQFEAMMIAQMLHTARENTEEGQQGSTMQDMADQQFSQVLSNNGGLGLASLIVKGINQGQKNADQHVK
jgi:flagellar protein FlgJ